MFIPFAAPVVALFFGGFARRLAWKEHKWSSFEKFSQRAKGVESLSIGLFVMGIIATSIIYIYLSDEVSIIR